MIEPCDQRRSLYRLLSRQRSRHPANLRGKGSDGVQKTDDVGRFLAQPQGGRRDLRAAGDVDAMLGKGTEASLLLPCGRRAIQRTREP